MNKKLSSILTVAVISIGMLVGMNPQSKLVLAADTESDLVLHWTFDGDYKESKANITTELGAKAITYTDGIYGKAAVFNGKDNYLIVQPNEMLNLNNDIQEDNNNFTISAWINLYDNAKSEMCLLDKGRETGWDNNDDYYWTNPYRLFFSDTSPVVRLSNKLVTPTGETEGEAILDGRYLDGQEWYLMTVTYDGSRIKLYRDNELIHQTNYKDGITYNEEELYIGVDHSLECFFKGAVDDLRMYTRTLSYEDVEQLYQQGVKENKEFLEPTKQLVAYYSFDGNLTDASVFEHDAQKITASGKVSYVQGMNGKAAKLAKGGYIEVSAADQLNFDTEFTISFWLKLDQESTCPILCYQNPSMGVDNDNDSIYTITADCWNGGESISMNTSLSKYSTESWCPQGGGSLSTYSDYNETKIKGTSWFHYTVSYKDGEIKGYLNGKLVNKEANTDFIDICNGSGSLLIGYDQNAFLQGAIDELKIYNKCLTASEVKAESKRVDSISLDKKIQTTLGALAKDKTFTISEIILKDVDTGNSSTLKSTEKAVTFKSSNSKIFTVAKDGTLKGVKKGKAKLTVTYGGITKTYVVVVK